MAGTIKHRFQSAVADAGEAGMLGPDEWNDSLVASGGTNGDLFLRDTGVADGWSLLASAAAGQVLASGGAGSAPSWSATPTLTSLALSGLTANSFLYSGAAGALTTTAAPTNGQLLIGSTAAAPALGTITGTANRVTVTNGAGTITLSGPQDLATSSAVQFGSLSLSQNGSVTIVAQGTAEQARLQGLAAGNPVYQTWYTSAAVRRGYFGYTNTSSSSFTLMNEENGTLAIGTNNATAITIDGSQNVGIGTPPSVRLDVVAGAANQAHFGSAATHGLYLRGASAATHYNWLIAEQVNVNAALEVTPSTAVGGTTFSTPVAVFLQNGNVGIGTSSPGATLDAQGATGIVKVTSTTGTNTAQFSATNTGGAVTLGREDSTGGTFGQAAYASVLFSAGAYPLVLGTNSAARVTINSTGSVTFSTAGPHAIGGSTAGTSRLALIGDYTATGGNAEHLTIGNTVTAAANATMAVVRVSGVFTKAASGTHATIAGVQIDAPSVNTAAATVTNTAALLIAGPSTTTVTGLNYAAWVQGGNVRFGDGSQMTNVAMGRSATINSTVILTGGSASSAAYDLTAASGTLHGMFWKPSMQATGASTAHNAVTVQVISMADGVARTVTNQRGIYVDVSTKDVNTTVTNAYGIYVEAPTIGGTLNIGLYNGGTSTFVGAVTFSGAATFAGVGTTASAANAYLDNAASNNLLRSTSSLRYKTAVATLDERSAVDLIMGLCPIRYHSLAKSDPSDREYVGFGAEDVATLDDRFVTRDSAGRPDWVMYQALTAPLVSVAQVHQQRITAMQARIDELESEVHALRARHGMN